MKSLRDYFISEKLNLNGNISYQFDLSKKRGTGVKDRKFEIPKYNGGDIDIDTIWKEVKVPDGEWIVYLDQYRGKKPHFTHLGDFLTQLVIAQEDYEGITPDKVILYSSNDLDDAFEWYVNYLGFESILKMDDDYEIKEYLNKVEYDKDWKYKKTLDNLDFFINVKNKEWREKELSGAVNAFNKDKDVFKDWIDGQF